MAREWHGRRERRRSHLAATAPSSAKGRGSSSVTTASWAEPEGSRQPGETRTLCMGQHLGWLWSLPAANALAKVKDFTLATTDAKCDSLRVRGASAVLTARGACHEARLAGLRTCPAPRHWAGGPSRLGRLTTTDEYLAPP